MLTKAAEHSFSVSMQVTALLKTAVRVPYQTPTNEELEEVIITHWKKYLSI